MKSKSVFIYVTVVVIIFIGVFIVINKNSESTVPDLSPRSGDSNISAEYLNAKKAVDYYREQIEKNPDVIKNYVELAQIFLQEARVAGDHHEYLNKASMLINKALSLNSDNFDAMVTRASILMTLHQFKDAKMMIEKAIVINDFNAAAYGILCDANVELGLYDEAVKACDKMLSIRPDLRSYSRASYLREIYGEKQAAIDAMLLAVNAGVSGQENRAWALYNLSKLLLEQGKPDSAKFILEGILQERPDYSFALSGLAQVYASKKDYNKSVEFMLKAFHYMQDHSFLEQLADYYKSMGNESKAEEFIDKALFEFDEHKRDGWNVNHEYAVFCSEHNLNLEEALESAEKDFKYRPDNIDALDTYAWLLHKNGRSKDAVKYIEQAMRLNTNRASMLYHAGVIFNAAGQKDLGMKYFKLSMETNQYFHQNISESDVKIMKQNTAAIN